MAIIRTVDFPDHVFFFCVSGPAGVQEEATYSPDQDTRWQHQVHACG